MIACPNCAREACPMATAALTDWRDVNEAVIDCERAKSARLESELAAERARADAAERERDDLLRSDGEIASLIGTTADDTLADAVRRVLVERDVEAAHGAMLREVAQRLATAFATYCKSRPGDESHHIAIREFYRAGYALDDLLAAAPSTALARVQGIVEAARRIVTEDATRDHGGLRADLRVALDAFTGTNTGDGQ